MKLPWRDAALCGVAPRFERVDGLSRLVRQRDAKPLAPDLKSGGCSPGAGGSEPAGPSLSPLNMGSLGGPLPSLPALGEARSQPLPREEGRSRHPTLFLLGGHMPQNPPRAGAFRPSVRMYSLWLLH